MTIATLTITETTAHDHFMARMGRAPAAAATTGRQEQPVR
jgi:hypothetical protein